MRCRFVKEIFHNKDNGFCIFVYHTEDTDVPEAAKDTRYKGKGARFTATGNGLPDTEATEAELTGNWVKNKYGLQLQVESYEEILPQTKEGIKGYLSSGMIKGIGPKLAELIVEKFGTRTFDVLDNYPDSLLEIKGIKASIVMSRYNSTIYLSARSIDEINVQVLMEKLGGGGHRTIAGAQLPGASVEEAKEKLKKAIEEMLEEGEVS